MGTSTILAVDDEMATLLVLESVLRTDESYKVVTARNVDDAMKVAERERPDVVITDRVMPGKDGLVLCKWIKAHESLSGSMVMLLTASGEKENIVQGLDVGADDYLVKPFHADELHSRVRALLRIKRLSDQLKQDNSRLEELNTALSENLNGVMYLITHMIELRVPDATVRAERASRIAAWIGKKLGLEPDALNELEMATRIHEIGKIIMPDDVLGKAHATLTSEQRETLSQFPVFGQMLVGRIPGFHNVAMLVRQQMENVDGTGLPDHLMGKQIAMGARILRAINILEDIPGDASADALIDALQKERGTKLDPVVIQCTVEYVTTLSDPEWLKGKHQVAVQQLVEGMVIAADISTAKGIKLLPRETRLTRSHINWIQAQNNTDPILGGIYVYGGP